MVRLMLGTTWHSKLTLTRYYDEECPAYFGLVPRDIKKPVRWFKYHNSMPIHTGASWEEDGKV